MASIRVASACANPPQSLRCFRPNCPTCFWKLANSVIRLWGVGRGESLLLGGEQDVHEAGLAPPAGAGSFICLDCSHSLYLSPTDEMPECPSCGGNRFRRASLFEQPTLRGVPVGPPAIEPKDWLAGVRDSIDKPGRYLAMFADGRSHVIELSDGWSRIGRSR